MSSKNKIRIFNEATAIVTGGASGIGRALARELAKRGCEVVLADRQIQLAAEVAAEIRASGGKATARELDVTDYAATKQLVLETGIRTHRQYGRMPVDVPPEKVRQLWEKLKPMPPDVFAYKAINAVEYREC